VGCVVVGSKTAPVEEVIQDGVNGFLVDFFSPDAIAHLVEEILDNPQLVQKVRRRARETILERFDLASLLPVHLHWLGQEVVSHR
jgi:glycosyltransferase involved in cell wall biosynthesis